MGPMRSQRHQAASFGLLVALPCSLTVPLGRAQGSRSEPEGAQLATAATATPRLQVVLILADDLGPGELGCHRQERLATPNIDRLAAAGMRFTQAYSASPVCAPSRCALLTGLHSGHARIRDNRELGGFAPGDAEGQWPLPVGSATLPVLLEAAGYRCGVFGKWGLGGPASSGSARRARAVSRSACKGRMVCDLAGFQREASAARSASA